MPMIEIENKPIWRRGEMTRVEIGERDKPIWVISKKGKYPSAETWNEI